jgi:hypothetical protein
MQRDGNEVILLVHHPVKRLIVELYDKVQGEYHAHGVSTPIRSRLIEAVKYSILAKCSHNSVTGTVKYRTGTEPRQKNKSTFQFNARLSVQITMGRRDRNPIYRES